MKTDNLILDKSKAFAISIVHLYVFLTKQKQEYVLPKQVLRSGTSVGANIREAVQGQSKAGFISKMSIALNEVSETEYWLELLKETSFIDEKMFNAVYKENDSLVKILTKIIETSEDSIPKKIIINPQLSIIN